MMVYLNEARQYQGGETLFHSSSSEEEGHVTKVAGAMGKGLVFEHKLWHEVQSDIASLSLSDLHAHI